MVKESSQEKKILIKSSELKGYLERVKKEGKG
jgi:hypothetical protein